MAKEKTKPAEGSVKEQESKVFVTRSIRIDKFNTKRIKVEVTPSTCNVCGHDMCSANRLPAYDDLSPKQQMQVDQLLTEHKERLHTVAEVRRAVALAKVLDEEAKEEAKEQ